MKLKISKMSGKLEGIPATCTDTTSNPFCQAMQKTDSICQECYSQAMLTGLRKNCKHAWQKNMEILAKPMQCENYPKFKERFARFQAHGELVNTQNAINLLDIARANPGTIFAFFTKRYRLVQKAVALKGKPDNVVLIYSSPKPNKRAKLPKFFDKTFTGYTDKNKKYVCRRKKCLQCLVCYDKKGIKHITEFIRPQKRS